MRTYVLILIFGSTKSFRKKTSIKTLELKAVFTVIQDFTVGAKEIYLPEKTIFTKVVIKKLGYNKLKNLSQKKTQIMG